MSRDPAMPETASERRGRGRPTLYTEELAAEICERLVNGESLRSICRDESMPAAPTVCLWRLNHPAFAEHYALAQETRGELGFDDIQEVADNGTNDWMSMNDPENPGYKANGEHIQRSRLRVDTMKWRLARMNPKRYGDKVAIGGDPDGAPIRTESNVPTLADFYRTVTRIPIAGPVSEGSGSKDSE